MILYILLLFLSFHFISMPVGFVGLGAMGYHMAGHMAKSHAQCLVWNRTGAKARNFQFIMITKKIYTCSSVAPPPPPLGMVMVCPPHPPVVRVDWSECWLMES